MKSGISIGGGLALNANHGTCWVAFYATKITPVQQIQNMIYSIANLISFTV